LDSSGDKRETLSVLFQGEGKICSRGWVGVSAAGATRGRNGVQLREKSGASAAEKEGIDKVLSSRGKGVFLSGRGEGKLEDSVRRKEKKGENGYQLGKSLPPNRKGER